MTKGEAATAPPPSAIREATKPAASIADGAKAPVLGGGQGSLPEKAQATPDGGGTNLTQRGSQGGHSSTGWLGVLRRCLGIPPPPPPCNAPFDPSTDMAVRIFGFESGDAVGLARGMVDISPFVCKVAAYCSFAGLCVMPPKPKRTQVEGMLTQREHNGMGSGAHPLAAHCTACAPLRRSP